MAKFRQKVLDVRSRQSIEGLEAQCGVVCDTRTANLICINYYPHVWNGGRSSLDQLLDDTSPEQLPELIPEALGLFAWPRDMSGRRVGC